MSRRVRRNCRASSLSWPVAQPPCPFPLVPTRHCSSPCQLPAGGQMKRKIPAVSRAPSPSFKGPFGKVTGIDGVFLCCGTFTELTLHIRHCAHSVLTAAPRVVVELHSKPMPPSCESSLFPLCHTAARLVTFSKAALI